MAGVPRPPIYRHEESQLLVGVPGSGKSWITDQVGDGYNHIRHDDYDAPDYADALIGAADDREILAEAPFRAQALTERLQAVGITVESYYVDEPLEVCRDRHS